MNNADYFRTESDSSSEGKFKTPIFPLTNEELNRQLANVAAECNKIREFLKSLSDSLDALDILIAKIIDSA